MLRLLNRRLVLLLAAASLAGTVSALLTVAAFGMVSQSRTALLPPFDPGLYAIVWCVLVAVSVCASKLLSKHSSAAVYHVRTSLIRRVLATDYDTLERVGSARLQNVLTTDVTNVANMLSELPTLIFNVALLICCLSYLAVLSPEMFAVLAAAMAVAFLIARALIARLSRHSRALRDRQDEMLESYRGMLDGNVQLAVDASRKASYYATELETAAGNLREQERRFRFFWDFNRSTTAALVLMFLGVLTQTSRMLGDDGVLLSFTLIVTYCAGPFATVVNLAQLTAQANVSLRKIEALKIGSDRPVTASMAHAPAWRTLRWSQLQFAYPSDNADERFALGPITLEARKGEIIFITGGNGSGKSTFLKLLLGLHTPSAGQISMDGVPVETPERSAAYRSLFSIVLPEFHLFRQVLGRDGAPARDHDVKELLELFNLQSCVSVEGGHLSTVRLSNGQRKRLALVSALSQDKDIYVLDEWAADQDPHYREVFYRKIIPWMRDKGKTVIAVTHDDRYFDVADRRIEFEFGKIRYDSDVATSQQSQRQATWAAT